MAISSNVDRRHTPGRHLEHAKRITLQVNGWNYPARYWINNHMLHVRSAAGSLAVALEHPGQADRLATELLRQIVQQKYPDDSAMV